MYLSIPHIFLPVARYAYPAIVPTVFILVFGWLEWIRLADLGWRVFKSRLGRPQKLSEPGHLDLPVGLLYSFYLAFFLALDLMSVLTIARYYGKL